jgi:hypothetical protein
MTPEQMQMRKYIDFPATGDDAIDIVTALLTGIRLFPELTTAEIKAALEYISKVYP